jgi:dTDP-4-amino-4,6-dideoxygalactose transaminase
MISGLVQGGAGIVDLPEACGMAGRLDLLRYPLLLDAGKRDSAWAFLKRRGLGPSGMYLAPLPRIPGIEGRLAGAGRLPAAEAFAKRVLTLPLHGGVRAADVGNMERCLLRAGI